MSRSTRATPRRPKPVPVLTALPVTAGSGRGPRLTTHVLMGESVAYPHCAAGDARTAAAGGAVLLGADSISPS